MLPSSNLTRAASPGDRRRRNDGRSSAAEDCARSEEEVVGIGSGVREFRGILSMVRFERAVRGEFDLDLLLLDGVVFVFLVDVVVLELVQEDNRWAT